MEIYIEGLWPCETWRIATAFERCIKECEFMPKLRDVFDKMPEAEPTRPVPDYGKVLREWTMPCGSNSVAHYFETEKGGTLCRIERR